MVQIQTADQKPLSIGKKYYVVATYLFGVGQEKSQIIISGLRKPEFFEFTSDSFLMEKNRLTFVEYPNDSKQTHVYWKIFSRRKSYAFKVIKFCLNMIFELQYY
jgi:hypothetical protein